VKPVDTADVPEYYEHIQFAMDLRTIGERLRAKYYRTPHLVCAARACVPNVYAQFRADVRRMLHNCYKFNAENTLYYQAGIELDKYFEELWSALAF
jgi:histone acetyltransferase